MIRFIAAVISLLVFFVFCLILMPIEWLIGKISKQAQEKSRFAIVQVFARFLLLLSGVKVTVLGRDRVPDRSCLFTPNHRSAFDILVTLAYAPTMPAYISKKEWQKIPLLSWWITWMHGFYLDRSDVRQGLKVILSAVETVRGGQSVIVFPEGTRNRGDDELELLPFHEGTFKIATKSGCPIIPVALSHTSQVFEDQFPRIKAAHVVLEYGTPIDAGALSREEQKFLGRQVQEIVAGMLRKNQAL